MIRFRRAVLYMCILFVVFLLVQYFLIAYFYINQSVHPGSTQRTLVALQLSHVMPKDINFSTLTVDSSCQPAKTLTSTQNILVIGASSFLGSHISIALHRHQESTVWALEDMLSLRSSSSLLWYRWEQLMAEGVHVSRVDLSNSSEVCEVLKKTYPHVIVYIPTVLFDGHQVSDVPKHEKIVSSYQNFLLLVNIMTSYKMSRLVFLTLSTTTASIQSGWLRAFEQTLLAYQNTHQLSVDILSMDGVYGPWKDPIPNACIHIDDISNAVMGVVFGSPYKDLTCTDTIDQTKEKTEWLDEYAAYLKEQNKMVVVCTYFTQQRNRQYKITFNQDNFRFLEDWFLSLYKLNIPMVIFHDSLSDAFTSQVTSVHPQISFIQVKDFHSRASNDIRFFLYYDYLLKHPEVSHIIMTDLRDVRFLSNPFEVFSVLGDRVYVGLDRPFFVTSAGSSNDNFYSRCLPNVDFEWERNLLGSYNAGVLGGSRSLMLSVLAHLMQMLDLNVAENCNMPALFYSLHRHYFEEVFYGWPYQVGFDTLQVQVVGNCIVHKYPPVLPSRKSKRRKPP